MDLERLKKILEAKDTDHVTHGPDTLRLPAETASLFITIDHESKLLRFKSQWTWVGLKPKKKAKLRRRVHTLNYDGWLSGCFTDVTRPDEISVYTTYDWPIDIEFTDEQISDMLLYVFQCCLEIQQTLEEKFPNYIREQS